MSVAAPAAAESSDVVTEAFFLGAEAPAGGQRFCLLHTPLHGAPKSAIVYVHPFAEEMNKARRMAALQARAFAAAGHAVLQIDLLGCGDSSGEFADASWNAWVDDVLLAARWLGARVAAPLWLWGLRAGCLLAAEAAPRLAVPSRLLCWQAPASGATLLTQFLRLRAAGERLAGTGEGSVESLRADLRAGRVVDIAGYGLAPGVAEGFEKARFGAQPAVRQLEWLELSTREDATLLPASARAVEAWQRGGCAVRAQVVNGPAFWQTSEIEEAPALLEASLAALQREVVGA